MRAVIAAVIPQADPLPLPAPPWLVWGLLMLTFLLHVLVMNFVLGGSLIALVARARSAGSENSRRLAHWLARLLPTGLAATITFGVAPLLFVQVLYGRLLFSSAVLMAWIWLAVIPLLIVAYYGTYLISFRGDALGRATLPVAGGVAILLLTIGFIYSNNMSLMLRPERFQEMFRESARGLHLNLADATLLPRYLHMVLGAVALAGLIVAFYGLAAGRADREHGRWAIRHGALWFVLATALNVVAGIWWMGALPRDVLAKFSGKDPAASLWLGSGILLGFGALLLAHRAIRHPEPGKLLYGTGGLLALSLVTMLFARDRLRVIMLEPSGFTLPEWVQPQWDVIAIFLILLVVALGTTIWMAAKLLAGTGARSR